VPVFVKECSRLELPQLGRTVLPARQPPSTVIGDRDEADDPNVRNEPTLGAEVLGSGIELLDSHDTIRVARDGA
jgi:hypothetical protein